MLLIKFLRYILGYVKISINGEFPEKLLNIFLIKKVTVWEIKKYKNCIVLKLSINNFKKMRELRAKTQLRIKILEKHGIIFIIKKYVKRIGIPIGVSIFLLTIYMFSLFIWNIEVVGNNNVETKKILKTCEELGVKNGSLISSIDSLLLREKLILSCDGIAWCSFNIEGSRLTVNISEISKNNDENTPSNIVSQYDGIITEILVESGTPCVERGQVVQKGDILISGIVQEGNYNKFLRPRGVVKAEIIETVSVEGEFSGSKLQESGKVKRKNVIEIFSLKIPLYLGKIKQPYHDKLIIKNFRLFGEKIPILKYQKSFYILENINFNYSREELLEILNIELQNQLKEKSEKIEVLNRSISEEPNKLTISYDVKYNQEIGFEEKINFNISK